MFDKKSYMKVYNKTYRQTHGEYYKEYDRTHWKKYYYGNHKEQKEYRRKLAEKYRRAKGVRPQAELIGEEHPSWKGGLPKCIDCNRQISRRDAIRCFTCNRKYLSGERNPMWNGGHSAWRKSLYSTRKYKNWREKVFKRDDYTCQVCFKQGGGLEAHHKKRMILLVKEVIPNVKKLKGHIIKNMLLEYEPLWVVENGITLCIDCHNKEKSNDRRLINQCLKAKK